MSEQYAVEELAQAWGIDTPSVQALIAGGQLETVGGGSQVRIPKEAVAEFEAQKLKRRDLSGVGKSPADMTTVQPIQVAKEYRSAISRRLFLKFVGKVGTAILGYGVARTLDGARNSWDARTDKERIRRTFESVFGYLGPEREFSFSIGRSDYRPLGYHVDNVAAEKGLAGPLGLVPPDMLPLSSESGVEVALLGDIVLIGGPASTPLTSIAFGYVGERGDQVQKSVLPLRYTKIASGTDPRVPQDYRVTWNMEHVGLVPPTLNYCFVDNQTGDLFRPHPGTRAAADYKVYFPLNDYLLVTRLPNFLDPRLDVETAPDWRRWPHLLVFQGVHGLGTRAAELLGEPAGLDALEQAGIAVKGASAFQLLLETSGLADEDGKHRFRDIQFKSSAILDPDMSDDIYRQAHEKALRKLVPPGQVA